MSNPNNPVALFEISSKAIIAHKTASGEHQFLLLKRVANPVENGFYWDLPGGRLDQEDNLKIALERELEEEIGQTVSFEKQQPIIGHAFWDPPVGARKLLLYQLVETEKYSIDPEQIVLSEEHLEARWFTETEIKWTGDCFGAEMETETSEAILESLNFLNNKE
jgi:8-oxo-dGTP pyrophosphatase MutT (NUDIX family)